MIDTSRHEGLVDPQSVYDEIHIIGCGGIGSHIAVALVRMGFGLDINPIHLWDSDKYEGHNVANQCIEACDVGGFKPEQLAYRLNKINRSAKIYTHNVKVVGLDHDKAMRGVVIVCVDCMTTRFDLMRSRLQNNPLIQCVIETRMDSGVGVSHCFDPNAENHCDCWWTYWHDPKESESLGGCSGHYSIISAVFGTAALALRQFESYCRESHTSKYFNRVWMDFDLMEKGAEYWPLDKP